MKNPCRSCLLLPLCVHKVTDILDEKFIIDKNNNRSNCDVLNEYLLYTSKFKILNNWEWYTETLFLLKVIYVLIIFEVFPYRGNIFKSTLISIKNSRKKENILIHGE